MTIWKLIETVHNILIIMAYTSVGLWTIALIINIIRKFKNRRNRK